jgi:phosphoribosylamine--glycine ligase
MRVLLIGSGGRESALAWALGRSPLLTDLTCAPGNPGIARHARRVAIGAEEVGALAAHAIAERYDLVVVGPEAPLVAGLADRLRDAGRPVFGPSAAAAAVEGSKAFSKAFMARHGIPTAAFRIFDDLEEARRYLRSPETAYPLVVKADGLAAGKGVVIAGEPETAQDAATEMLSGRAFGDAGRSIVVEERLVGREMSYFVLADGEAFVELAPCRDYKRVGDGDLGPNTGGMGTFSPAPGLDRPSRERLRETIVRPTIRGLAAEGRAFQGVLFIGLMLTESGPRVLEYNARFGDPETQVLVPRLDGDWLPLLLACAEGRLGRQPAPAFREDAAVCVVMASGGYPGATTKGRPIHGIEAAEAIPGVVVFHAGTEIDVSGRLVTAGGRVLGVTATGHDLPAARETAYRAVAEIHWDGEHHRSDIAAPVSAAEDRGGA